MITQNEIAECNAVLDEQESRPVLPSLQEQIDAQRRLCFDANVNVQKYEQARDKCQRDLENAEAIREIRQDTLSELLNLQDLMNSPRLEVGEHNVYPNGRGAAIPT